MRVALTILSFLTCTVVLAQTRPYSPSRQTGIQKPLGVSGMPSDGRTYYYDSTALYIRYRPFVSTQEALEYINTPDKRKGHAPVIINSGGTLHNGIITGGVDEEWWFKNGVADSNLVIKSKTLIPIDETLKVSGAGVLGVNGAFFREYQVFSSTASLQAIPSVDAGTAYRVVENGLVNDYYVDTSDHTTAPDGVMVLLINGYRVKQPIEEVINVRKFGVLGNAIHDDEPGLRAAFNFVSTTGYRHTLYLPRGQYRINNSLVWEGNPITGQFPHILGESKGIGSGGATLIWGGVKGGTMVKIHHMIYNTIENIEFQGRNGADTTKLPKYLLHFERASAADYSTFNRVINCTFYTCGGDSSAMVNLNFGGAYQGAMMDEITFEGCKFAGNGFDVANKSAFGVIIGGANTKNFTFRSNSFIGFSKACIKAFYCGPLHTTANMYSNSEKAFDLDNGTSFISLNDYSESVGQIFGTPGGGAMGSFIFKGFEDHSFNYKQAISIAYGYTVPETNPIRIQGVGQLTIEGSTFDNAPGSPGIRADSLSKIHWETMQDRSSLTVIGCNFSGARIGRTPFYSQGVPVGMQDHTENPAITGNVHLTLINNKGIDSTGQISIFLPNVMADEAYLVKGINKITTSVGKPTTGTWRIGDKILNTYNASEGPGGDGRHKVPSYIVTHSGMLSKTISITGTYTNASNWITNLSDSTKIDVGDIVELTGGFAGSGYVFEIAEKSGKKVRVSGITGIPTSGTGTVTIVNAVPVFTAEGRGFGTTTLRPGSSDLGTNDKGWQYWNTDSSKLQIWDGSAYNTIAGSGGAGSYVTIAGSETITGAKTFYNNRPDITSDGSTPAEIKLSSDAGNSRILWHHGTGTFRYDMGVGSGNDFYLYSAGPSGYPLYIDYTTGKITFIKAVYGAHPALTTAAGADSLTHPDIKYVDSVALSSPKQTHTAGATVTVTSKVNLNIWLVVNPASTLAALTVTLPATPLDAQVVKISFGGTLTSGNVVTALTVSPNSGQTLLQNTAPTSVEAGETIAYQYNSTNTKWYRVL